MAANFGCFSAAKDVCFEHLLPTIQYHYVVGQVVSLKFICHTPAECNAFGGKTMYWAVPVTDQESFGGLSYIVLAKHKVIGTVVVTQNGVGGTFFQFFC
jgi:hypothetical protein